MMLESNTFILSNFDTGRLDKEKYTKNMEIAMDTYMERVNHFPCGDAVINLYKGADSSLLQERRKFLLNFLKGSMKEKKLLQLNEPELFCYFDKVWSLRNRHMKPYLPSKYVFFFLYCLEKDCCRPFCQLQTSKTFNTGPSLHFQLLIHSVHGEIQIVKSYNDFCSDHFLDLIPKDVDHTRHSPNGSFS